MMNDNNKTEKPIVNNHDFFVMFEDLRSQVGEILQIMNNGLRKTVNDNCKKLDELKKEVGKIEKRVEKSSTQSETKKESQINTREWVAYALAILANIGLILSLFNVI